MQRKKFPSTLTVDGFARARREREEVERRLRITAATASRLEAPKEEWRQSERGPPISSSDSTSTHSPSKMMWYGLGRGGRPFTHSSCSSLVLYAQKQRVHLGVTLFSCPLPNHVCVCVCVVHIVFHRCGHKTDVCVRRQTETKRGASRPHAEQEKVSAAWLW